MKKFSLVLALAMAFMLTIGVSVAMAAPGDYLPGTQTTADKYTTTLTGTEGKTDTTTWGLSNGLNNANQTGKNSDLPGDNFADTIKNVNGQRTHGEYANDTNSCASCHQTHTASGRQLLFKNGIYNTCVACHDGTLGFYNVLTPSNAGTFGGNPDKAVGNASVHLATGVMTGAAAPGGNRTSTDATTWGKNFTCASCHSPHGSYSDRLLHYNPNGIGTLPPTVGADGKTFDPAGTLSGGKLVMNATIAFDSATSKFTASTGGPWLYGYTYASPKKYWSQIRVLYDSNVDGTPEWNYKVQGQPTKSYNDVLEVNYRGGFFKDPTNVLSGVALTAIQMDVAPVTVVKVSANLLNTVAGIPVTQVVNYKSGVNAFCAACHTDYNANSAAIETGTFSKAFRHKIVQGLKIGMIGEEKLVSGVLTPNQNMVCLSCHFAHGSDISTMIDARDTAVTIPDVNASSALKRYTNMAVCWKCHTDSKAEQLKNNASYWDKVDAGTAPIH